MKSEIYKSLNEDLKYLLAKENNNQEEVNDLQKIICKINTLNKIYKVTDDDMKIVISDVYADGLREIAYQKSVSCDKKEIECLEKRLEIYMKYFENEDEALKYSLKDTYSFGDMKECQRIISFVSQDKNRISSAFNTCAVFFIIIGLISAIYVGVESYSFMVFLITFGSILSGALILFGLAELFQILHDIRKKLYTQK